MYGGIVALDHPNGLALGGLSVGLEMGQADREIVLPPDGHVTDIATGIDFYDIAVPGNHCGFAGSCIGPVRPYMQHSRL